MEIFLAVLRYGFLVALIVEAVLVGRALVRLAVEKARPVDSAPTQE